MDEQLKSEEDDKKLLLETAAVFVALVFMTLVREPIGEVCARELTEKQQGASFTWSLSMEGYIGQKALMFLESHPNHNDL